MQLTQQQRGEIEGGRAHASSHLQIERVRKVNDFSSREYLKRLVLGTDTLLSNVCVIKPFLVFIFNSTGLKCLKWEQSSAIDFDDISIDDAFVNIKWCTIFSNNKFW